MSTAPIDYRPALDAAITAAREGGAILRDEFYHPGGPRHIDEQVERHLRHRLQEAQPRWGYRGEETGAQAGADAAHCWVVDPNDGTSYYEAGRRGSAVSIAALRDGVPVLGVVYAFGYPDDDGDLIAWAEGCGAITRNGRSVDTPLVDADLTRPDVTWHDPLVVFLAPAAERFPALNATLVRPARYVAQASIAYRLARVAVGDGVATISINNPVDWDFAAGHALLRAAGGVLVDPDGKPVTYSRDGRSAPGDVFGGGRQAADWVRQRDWGAVRTAKREPSDLLVPAPGRAVRDAAVLRRAQGCLLGQLAGDALGGLVEFQDRAKIAARYPDGVRQMADGGTWDNLAGQPTDDSELALTLARCLVRHGQYDRGAALDAYCDYWPRAWDRGGTLQAALGPASRVKATADRLALAEQSANHGSQSNGSLMRISPAGIFAAGRPERAAALARQDSGLTHPNRVCVDACAAYAAAVAVAIATGDREAAYQAAVAEASRPDASAAVRATVDAARHAPPDDFETNMGWVRIALQNALYQAAAREGRRGRHRLDDCPGRRHRHDRGDRRRAARRRPRPRRDPAGVGADAAMLPHAAGVGDAPPDAVGVVARRRPGAGRSAAGGGVAVRGLSHCDPCRDDVEGGPRLRTVGTAVAGSS
ncbi:MAG: inositol monophosphatase family protein [Gemmataceae bacterium]